MTKKTLGLRKVAEIHDHASDLFKVLIEVRLKNGKLRRVELSPSLVSDPKSLESKLLDIGADLPISDHRRESLKKFGNIKAEQQISRVARSGWLPGERSFAVQSRIVGKNTSSVIGLPEPGNSNERGWFAASGTWKTWARTVAPLANSSSILTLGIAASFAAPLLHLLKQQSFSLCISGPTRSGKSMASLLASSVVGIGRIDMLPTWHSTDAGQEELMPRFNDCLAPIDDFESMKGTATQKYQRIRDFSYSISAGSERRRHTSFETTTESWNVILLTSMESPIYELARSVGEERRGGESIRMIDVPVLSNGRKHIFDRARAEGIKPTPKWRIDQFRRIQEACGNNHGAVFIHYAGGLCRQPKTFTKDAEKYTARFVDSVISNDDRDLARDVAQKFGIIYAGGMIAIDLGILPWTAKHLQAAISSCYFAARDSLNDEGVLLRSGRRMLIDFLRSLKPRGKIKSYRTERGYSISLTKSARYYAKIESINGIFQSKEQRRLTLQDLIMTGKIRLANAKKGKSGPKEQFTWPDGKRRRSYRIEITKEELAKSSIRKRASQN